MIGGFPWAKESSFFFQAMERISNRCGIRIESKLLSLSGFPSSKAATHLSRVLDPSPDWIVIQLGSTDLTVDLKSHILGRLGLRRRTALAKKKNAGGNPFPPPNLPLRISRVRRLIDRMKDFLCQGLDVPPIHGDDSAYLESMRRLADRALTCGAQLILIAPFPHGDPVSDRWSLRYGRALRTLAETKGVFLVDVREEFKKHRLEEMLLMDRLHLSKAGHDLVAESLARCLEERWKDQATQAA